MSTPASLKRMEKARTRNKQQQPAFTSLSFNRFDGSGRPFVPGQNRTPWPTQNSSLARFNNTANIDFTEDYDGDSLAPQPPRPFNKESPERKTIDGMPDMGGMMSLTVEPTAILPYFGKHHFLSTLHPCKISIEGNVYPSVEHYYQACKLYTLASPALAGQLRNFNDAGQVKQYARNVIRNLVSKKQLSDWKENTAPEILSFAIWHKFTQNPVLEKKLLDTGDALIVHSYERDTLFASGLSFDNMKKWAEEHKGEVLKVPTEFPKPAAKTIAALPSTGLGKNVLGIIHMQIRERLRQKSEIKTDIQPKVLNW